MTKSLRVALQMDPLAGINIKSDSTFLLGLGAQELGHSLYAYQPEHLFWHDGAVMARASAISLRREEGNHFTVHSATVLNLSTDVDVILLRQDPPFDMGYITNTHLLDQVKHTRIVNNPSGVRNAPEKLLILRWPELIASTLIASDADAIMDFAIQHGDVVAKKLYSHASRDVHRFSKHQLSELLYFAAEHRAATKEPLMLQHFLPEVYEGDKRIIIFNGEPVAAIKNIPATGEFLSNRRLGGVAHPTELTVRDHEICAAIGPTLRELGLYFVGIDVIGDYLTEINVTSPAGLQGINRMYDLQGDARMEILFWKKLLP